MRERELNYGKDEEAGVGERPKDASGFLKEIACDRAGIQDFTFHDLRHTFASHLVMAGEDIASVSKLLGHASIHMTMKYSHLYPDHLKNAVSRLVDIFSSQKLIASQRDFYEVLWDIFGTH